MCRHCCIKFLSHTFFEIWLTRVSHDNPFSTHHVGNRICKGSRFPCEYAQLSLLRFPDGHAAVMSVQLRTSRSREGSRVVSVRLIGAHHSNLIIHPSPSRSPLGFTPPQMTTVCPSLITSPANEARGPGCT